MGTGSPESNGLLAAAAKACEAVLATEPFVRFVQALGPTGTPGSAFRVLEPITTDPESGAEIRRLQEAVLLAGTEGLERTLLLLASLAAIPQVPRLPVSEGVKRLFAEEFQFYANPPTAWAQRFRIDDLQFRAMARNATLRRFPAGQFHWEISGFPRSWLAKSDRPVRAATQMLLRMHGFGPLMELHLNDRRKNKLVILEKESNLSYYRAARSMEKQPHIKGLMTTSWLFCKTTGEVTPHLGWLRRGPLEGGAMVINVGPAPADGGFLKGSDERRKLYEQGLYRPQNASLLWPRKSLLAWADQHPELAE